MFQKKASMEFEIVPMTEISSDDPNCTIICRYLEETEEIPELRNISYSYSIQDNDDDIVFWVGGYKNPYKDKAIKDIRVWLGVNKHTGDNFQKVYAEIASISHIILAINKEKRGKHKRISKVVRQAIEIYKDVDPENYEIYRIHRNLVDQRKRIEQSANTLCASFVMVALANVMLIALIVFVGYLRYAS